jgi:hypothetical protein
MLEFSNMYVELLWDLIILGRSKSEFTTALHFYKISRGTGKIDAITLLLLEIENLKIILCCYYMQDLLFELLECWAQLNFELNLQHLRAN